MVLEYLDKIHADPDFEGTEAALRTLFARIPTNDRCDEVLPKVVTLNTLYSAGLRFIELHPMARHICRVGIDGRLEEGDLGLVRDIANPLEGESFRISYSFATKYCSFHRPVMFPIYDQYVDRLL